MTVQHVVRLAMVSGLLALPPSGWAQTVVSGTIAGMVTDATGAVLPGVTLRRLAPR